MMNRLRILLALAACALPAFSQDASKDDMWKMLNRTSSLQARDDRSRLAPGQQAALPGVGKDAKADSSLLQNIYRKLALGAMLAGKETWPEANLKYEFPAGWRRTEGGTFKEIVRTYIGTDEEKSLVVSFTDLTQGETMTMEKLLKIPVGNAASGKVDLKPVEAKGRAAELGMVVFEGTAKADGAGPYQMTLGRMIGKGAVYGICSVAKTREEADREFERFLKTLAWIKKDKDLSKPAITGLAVNGAGFTVPCEGALMAECPAELPHGSAALRLDQRLEISALDVRGCEIPPQEMAEAFLEMLAVSTGGNYQLEEQTVGGVAGWVARPKRSSKFFGMDLDWRIDFALRDGFFCLAMGTWVRNIDEYEKRHEQLIGKIRFEKPDGDPGELTADAQKNLAGLFYNEIGLKGFRKGQYNIATKAFERAAELNPKDANIAQNLINSLTKQGRVKSALAAVEKSRAVLPDHQELKQWHAALLIRSGRDEEGQALFEKLFQGGLREQNDLGMWIESLQKSGKNERAAEIAKTVFDETGQISWRRLLANCLWTAGKLDEARAHYKELEADLGEEQGFAADHASLLLEAGDFNAVMALVNRWEKDNEAPSGMLYSKGMAQSGLGWYKDAVATFTQLDGMVPGNQTVKEALANAQAMMGRGSQEGIRDDLKEVTVPQELLDHAAEALSAADIGKDYAGEGSIYLTDIRVWDWSEGSDARMTQHQRIKILDASGVKAFSTLYVPFKPHAERVNINRMVVTDGNGKELATYRREEMHIRDGNGELADGQKIVCLPVPTLEEGAVIDFIHTKVMLGTDKLFPMTTGGISEFSGLVYGAEAYTGEIDKIRFSSTDRMKEVGNGSFHGFEARNLKRRIGTSHLMPYDRWAMMCWACDKRSSWETETSDYLTEIHDCLSDDAFAAKVVEDLELAGKSPAEVTHRVVRWLNEKFQYQGLEFGRRARIPAKGEITLSRGFGDCKDLSVMVRAILRKSGVKANLALVNSGGIVREDMQSFDQFDHMVLHLPEMGGTVLDATMQHFNTPEALASSAIGAKAYVIEGDHPGFVSMNEAPGTERLTSVDRTVSIDPESGDARVRETVNLSPAEAGIFRYTLSATAGAERMKTMETLLRRKESRIELKDFKVADLDDPFKAMRMEFDYEIRNAFQSDGEILSGTLPHIVEGWMFEMDQERDRSIGTMFRTAERGVVSSHIRLPDGYKWIAPTELKREVVEPGSFAGSVEWKPETGGIRMDASLGLIPSSGDAELYQRVREASDGMFRLLGERVRFGKE